MLPLRQLFAILILPGTVVVHVPRWLLRNEGAGFAGLMLSGEALFFGSRSVAVWAAAFLLANHVYFVVLEEPGLEERFGDEYRAYKAHVPRWIPRLRPWPGASRRQ